MKSKHLLLGFIFIILFSFSALAQTGSDGGGTDAREARITMNKRKVKKKAKKKLDGVCRHGFEITRVEEYKGLFKVHFKTYCEQSGEVHYYQESGKYKETIWH